MPEALQRAQPQAIMIKIYHNRCGGACYRAADVLTMKSLSARQSVETLSAVVSGKVQGVGFRAATVRQAHLLKLGGWVRNLSDGRVEIRAEGDADALERFERAVRRGPSGARVDEFETTDVGAGGNDSGFSILPS